MDAFVDTLQDFVQNKKALVACVIVMINPLFWNVVSRYEYKTQKLSRTLGGPKRGCATLAACILTLNYVRTATFHKTVDEFGYWEPLHNGMVQALGYLIVTAGSVLVVASAWKLGFFVSFMGDYFGILLTDKVTGFPFNVVRDPMYFGSGLVYLGLSLEHASVVGLVLTSCIAFSYAVAVRFEGPFTCQIYEERNKKSD
ncbi:Phosphatidylethanolamine N-methyltransferase [Geodia barretti]|uniref:Phosphatidylethanolamine N-methyltransferase n=1 Tax=Geodia barretti TaxID=519541 RepID=A0AA35RB80_GEOBA|nr:Phosphatidylethanolamine N-methyltransferase [Geodia barretti]